MSIMTPFFNSIGLDHSEIAYTQIIFTIVALLLNVPTGWLADRFSRKWANIIGDFGFAVVHLFYAQAHCFSHVVICECLLGVFRSLSQGVDQTLLRHFSHQLDPSEEFFRRQTAQLNLCHYLCTLVLVAIGGPLGAISFRLAIGLSGVPYLIAGCISLLIVDDSPKLSQQRSSIADIRRIVGQSFRNRPLCIRILAYAFGREMTHAIIWVFTPMLLLVGLPLEIASLAWAFNSLTCLLGSVLAKRYAQRLADWQLLAFPVALMGLSMGVLSWRINLLTICFYSLMGIVQGWTGSTLMPLVQQHTAAQEQTTVISLAHTLSRLIYIPVAALVGSVADRNLRYAPLCVLAFFLPIGSYLVRRLRK